MKQIRFQYISLLASLLVLFQYSCNKLVDLKPINEISDADFWKTADQFKLAANEFYTYEISFGNVLYDPPPGGSLSSNSAHSDLRGDLLPSTNAFSLGTNTTPQTDANWNT